MASDDFFREVAAEAVTAPDLAFIDGMHLFEYALRDFMHIERMAKPGTLVVIDDIHPSHPAQAERERRTRVWTGDIWKLHECLAQVRPDLVLIPLDTAPTGLLLVAGLDPDNRVLWNQYNPIVRRYSAAIEPSAAVLQRTGSLPPDDPRVARALAALATVSRKRRRAQCGGVGAARCNGRRAMKLSVVVIAYNMARELPRTLQTLSPAFQRDIAAEDYEVIVVDNGSAQPLDEAACKALCPNARLHIVADAPPSPVAAINAGLALARGELIGVCIDGARMASPRLLATALEASRLHARPVIGTLAFHLGPDVQSRSVANGYDQTVEDALLSSVDWVADGYRLFSISVFASSSALGWFTIPVETNAMFLTREHWQRARGLRPGVRRAGRRPGEPRHWARACADPDGRVILLLGEATFHQVHGGIATNARTVKWATFHEEYVRVRGTAYQAPKGDPLFVGRLRPEVVPSLQASLQRLAQPQAKKKAGACAGPCNVVIANASGDAAQTARTWTVSASVPLFLPEAFHLSGKMPCVFADRPSHALVLLPVTNTPPPVTA